jgi:hypothetical protein
LPGNGHVAPTANRAPGAAPVADRDRLWQSRRLKAGPGRQKEETMAKGQMRSNKEAKKPKSDKPKTSVSEYKKSQGATGQALSPPGKKS